LEGKTGRRALGGEIDGKTDDSKPNHSQKKKKRKHRRNGVPNQPTLDSYSALVGEVVKRRGQKRNRVNGGRKQKLERWGGGTHLPDREGGYR